MHRPLAASRTRGYSTVGVIVFIAAAIMSVIGAIVGDFFFKQGQPGLGLLIDQYLSRLQTEQMYGDVILSSLLGIFAFLLVGAVAKRVVGPWYDSARTGGA